MDYPHYNPQSPNTPLSDDELDALDRLLTGLPHPGAMNIEAMDGFLTALLLGPAPLTDWPGADWLPLVWGGDGEDVAPFASKRQRKNTVVQVLRHLRHIDALLCDDPDSWQPVFSVAELEDGHELADARDWCTGFMQAVDLDREAWSALFESADTGPALVPVALLGAVEEELSADEAHRLEDPQVCDELSRAVPDAVLRLHQAARQRGS